MSGFFWNMRGFNKSNKHEVVQKWIQNSMFHFGGLIETRVKEKKYVKVVSLVFKDWSFLSNYEYNRLGRIWVVWSPQVQITPFFKSGQMITCSVLLDGSNDEFFCF